MATQVQLRRGTQAENNAFTGAAGEVVVATDVKRLALHDASTSGGVEFPNENDVINNAFTYALAGGTANALTLTYGSTIAAYATGQSFKFKAASTNTAAATLNVNSLGVKSIYKKDSGSASLVAVEANDIIIGGMYEVVYNGTYLLLASTDGGGVEVCSTAEVAAETGVAKYVPPHYIKYSPRVAKAYGKVGGSTLTGAFNVSSASIPFSTVVRLNFTTALANANYTALATIENYTINQGLVAIYSKATTYVDFIFYNSNSGGTGTNGACNFVVFGDT